MGLKLNVKELAPLLDQATRQLPPDTIDRLHTARRAALARQKPTSPVAVLSRLRQLTTGHGADHFHHRALNRAAVLLLVAAVLFGVWQWQHQAAHEHTAIDLAILTDELPVHMYVD